MNAKWVVVLVSAIGIETAFAEEGDGASERRRNLLWQDVTVVHRRTVAEETIVLPPGVDVGGQLRMVMADGGVGAGAIDLTDVALFDATVTWALASRVQLDAAVSVFAKQPSTSGEQLVQGAHLGATVALAKRTAITAAGTLRPLLGVRGVALEDRLVVEHRHRLNKFVTFALAGGGSSTWLRETGKKRALIVEATGQAAVLAREPESIWGAWLGVGYSLPVVARGDDPVSAMSIDPQPRLDLRLGNAVQLAEHWDLAVEVAIVDRGDLAEPATRVPVLDGGFDQVQLVFGVSRRFATKRHVKTWIQRVRGW